MATRNAVVVDDEEPVWQPMDRDDTMTKATNEAPLKRHPRKAPTRKSFALHIEK